MPRFAPDDLLRLATDIFLAMGCTAAAAREVAGHLVDAALAGHDSHGLVRIPQYLEHLRAGKIDPRAEPTVVRETTTTALIDGNKAWGQVVARRALDLTKEKARAHGTAAVGVRNCYHAGRIGAYPLAAARAGLVCSVHANVHGVARVAPWGGTEAKLATNPIAIAFPRRGEPLLVDVTTSVVAEGKVRLARNAGQPIPEGWVLDRNGHPTTDPAALYQGGTLLPLGGREGHKGYGLGVAVDLLAGVLTGAGCGLMTKAVGNGLFFQAIDPVAFGNPDEILDRVEEFARYLLSSPRRPGVEEILLPGDPELRAAAARRQGGLEIDAGTWIQVLSVARELGVEAPAAAA